MRVTFQADANLDERIARGLKRRLPEIDCQSSYEAGLAGLADPLVLKLCAESKRILVTHDRRTMPRHFADFIRNQQSPGAIVIPKTVTIARAIEDLLLIWSASTPEEWQNRLVWIPL